MRKFILELCNQFRLWLQRTSEVARFEGIILADLKNSQNQTQHFRETFLASLRLLQHSDIRRFIRIQRHIAWITNHTLAGGGAEYDHAIQTCYVDFDDTKLEADPEYYIGYYACTLVHEATHGVIRSRGILYTPELRKRIERLCVREEQRFLLHLTLLKPDLAARINREFDVSDWKSYWEATPFKRITQHIRRVFKR